MLYEINNDVHCFYCANSFKEKKLMKALNVEPINKHLQVTFALVRLIISHYSR